MFKSWGSQKIKTKALFKLEFQATQVPQLKGKGLMISLIPADVGKPTAKLEKTAVVDGTCSWENPIYERVKLIKNHKTGKYEEKIYHFIVATGSSKSSYLGEASVDFTDFAEATNPLQISLLLTTSFSGAILHVTIQRMQEDDDLREFEETEPPAVESLRLPKQVIDCNGEDELNPQNDPQLDSNSVRGGRSTLRMNSMPQRKIADILPTEKHLRRKSSTDWSGSGSDRSIADSSNSPEDNHPRHMLPEASNNSIETYKSEIRRLERQAELSEIELQSLRKQIVKETKRGQDLSRQIVVLREEKDSLKVECEQLKSSQKDTNETIRIHSESVSEELRVLLAEIKQELKHEKNLNSVLRLQLQKTEDSNSELILAVNDLDKTLEQKDAEISRLSHKLHTIQDAKTTSVEASQCKREQEEEELLKQKVRDLHSEIELHKKEKEELKIKMERLSLDYEYSEQENADISLKLEQIQIEHMNMQNEYSKSLATIKENEVQVERLEEKIKKQALEFSQTLDSISELETHVKSLEEELEKQGHNFEVDLESLTRAKVEQEQRAIRAEEALRKTRLINATAAEQLQDQFRRLSLEMTSKLDENEKQATQAAAESQELRLQVRALQEMLKKSNEELAFTKEQYEEKLQKLSNEKDLQAKQMTLELEEKLRRETEKLEASLDESEKLPGWAKEKEELERELALLRNKANKAKEESIKWKRLKDEKENKVEILESEMRSLRAKYDDLEQSFSRLESENDNIRKEVSRLEDNLRKKQETRSSIQRNVQNNNGCHSDINSDRSKEDKSALLTDSAEQSHILRRSLDLHEENPMAPEASINYSIHDEGRNTAEDIASTETSTSKPNAKENRSGRNEGCCSEEDMAASNRHSSDNCNLAILLSEVATLNQRNKQMEHELKEMEEKYSEISLKFAEVEGERQQLVMTVRNLRNGKKK